MVLEEEIPVHFLDGEASKAGCHKKVLVVLWGHTELFVMKSSLTKLSLMGR